MENRLSESINDSARSTLIVTFESHIPKEINVGYELSLHLEVGWNIPQTPDQTTKLKAFADNNLNVTMMMISFFVKVESSEGKRKNDGSQHFIIFL